MSFRNIQVLLSADAGNLKRVLSQSATDVEAFTRSVNGAGRTLTAGKVALLGLAGAGTTAALGLAYAASQAIEFDKNMRNVNSLTGLSEEKFKALEDQVISLSKTLPQSASTLAEGLYDIASSGFQGAEGMKVLEASAAAASAGLTTTGNAAQAITAVLNAYGRSASDASDVSDVLFQTVNLGVVSFESLSGIIGDVVGTAAAAKVGIDQVGSAIATMTLTGISGSEAGTSLNRVLQSVIQPSDALAETFKKLGYESGAAALEQKGLRGVMDDVRLATGGNIEVLLELFPEIRAARGALALMANEGKNYAKVSAEIEDTEKRRGATQKTLNEQMKSTAMQFDLFKNSIDATAITIGTKVLPVINELMKVATQLGESMENGLNAASEQLAPLWDSLYNIGQNLWTILGEIWDVLEPLAAGFAALVGAGTVVALKGLASALESVTGFLADNRQIVIALVAIYAASYVPALFQIVRLNAAVGLAVLKASVSMGTARGAVTALANSLKGLASAEAVATLGITAIISAITAGMQGLDEAQQSGQDFANGLVEGMDKLDPGDIEKRLATVREAMEKNIKVGQDYFGTNGTVAESIHGMLASGFELITPLENTAADAAYQLDALRQKEAELEDQQNNLNKNLDIFGAMFNMTTDQVKSLAKAAGVDLTQSFDSVVDSMVSYQGATSGASASEQQLIDSLGTLSTTAGDASEKVDALKSSLDALLGVPMDLEEATSKYEDSLDKLNKTLEKNGKTMDLNTPKGRENKAAIRETVDALKDQLTAMAQSGATSDEMADALNRGIKRIEAQGDAAGISKDKMADLLAQYNLTPDLVETIVRAAGADSSKQDVQDLVDEIDKLKDKTVNITAKITTVGGVTYSIDPRTGKPIPMADGGLSDARIEKDGANLYQWAEPGTGGEAFIPLGKAKRARSEKILADVADRFGLRLVKMADGGISEAQDKRFKALQERRERARLRRKVSSWSMPVAFSLSGVMGNTESRLEQNARNTAELKARQSKNPYDTADDFYKKPKASLKSYQQDLDISIKRQNKWKKDLAKIAKVAGADVAEQLKAMGEQGVDLVAAMADGTDAEMKKMAASLKKLGPTAKEAMQDFQAALHTQATGDAQFAADLLKITQMGRADIAQYLMSMGPEAGGQIAHAIATGKASAADLNQMSADIAKSDSANSEDFAKALALAGVLGKSSKPLGLMGLSEAAGMSVTDTISVVNKYLKDVFSPMGAKFSQVQADLALIAAGKQPSGMSRGGIIAKANQTGLHYRWAEPGTGGESLIPLGMNNRKRSIDLWNETGRLLGVKQAANSAASMVSVASGAIQVSVAVSGANLTEAQVTSAVQAGVKQSIDRLTTQLRAGKGRN